MHTYRMVILLGCLKIFLLKLVLQKNIFQKNCVNFFFVKFILTETGALIQWQPVVFWCTQSILYLLNIVVIVYFSVSATDYKCAECGRVFRTNFLLRRHSTSHFNEKPHKCGLCPYEAARRDTLTRHMKRKHPDV